MKFILEARKLSMEKRNLFVGILYMAPLHR